MKLLCTDLDETLLNSKSQVSPETKAFLDEFLAAGNRLVLCSGRPLMSILEVKQNAGLTQPGIFVSSSNGSRIYDCDSKRTIMKTTIPSPMYPIYRRRPKNWICTSRPIGKTMTTTL